MHSMFITCGNAAQNAGKACGDITGLFLSQFLSKMYTWITTGLFRGLCTFCIQKCPAIVGKFTSVNYGFYTVYTGLITTTTN